MKQTRYLYICVCTNACVRTKLFQLCPTLCDPMGCNLPGSSVHGILQARILEWVTITSSRGPWKVCLSVYLSIYLSIYTHTYIFVQIYVCENLEGQYNLNVYLKDEVWGKRWGCQDRIIGKQSWRDQKRNSDWMSCAIFSRAEESKH